ncbi:MAG: hypothetical protein GY869_06160 [Planctomycetes bacterium]|nr:hypothetical protein [Planctomycetota bacterium]
MSRWVDEFSRYRFAMSFFLLAVGMVWVVGLDFAEGQVNQAEVGGGRFGFLEAGRLPGSTVLHSATRLDDGDVLVVGGYGQLFGKVPIATTLARVFDQESKSWRVLKGVLNYGRLGHGAIKMANGKVLIVGGRGQDNKAMGSVEVYDPAWERFEVVGKMAEKRLRPCLNMLSGGRVLVTGESKKAEIIEADMESETGYRIREVKGKSLYKHNDHVAVTLKDGAVLVVGGRSAYFERFDPVRERFTVRRVQLPKILDDQAAALLYDGKVLLAGGQEVYTGISVGQSWIYDPAADKLKDGPALKSQVNDLPVGASDMEAVDLFGDNEALAGRYILLCGGEYDPGEADKKGKKGDVVLRTAWVYDAERERLIDVGPMRAGHDDFAAVALENSAEIGGALIVGGYGPGEVFGSECEIFYWWLK